MVLHLIPAIASGILWTGFAWAASHREAPHIMEDPTADNTDVYAFVAPANANNITIIANYIPLEEPAGGPSFYSFSDAALYTIHIDTDRDAREDVKLEFRFRSEIRPGTGAFLYGGTGSTLPITALDGPGSEGLGVRQTYSVVLARGSDGKFKKRDRTDLGIATMYVVPPNIGGIVTPDYDALAQQGVYPLANGGNVFAGPRDDPFYVDLGAVSDSLDFRRRPPILTPTEDADDAINPFGVDSFAGYNVHSIAIELPKSEITSDPNATIGVWASASRARQTTRKGAPKLRAKDERDDLVKSGGAFVQVSRLGNPLVNELLIGALDKDLYNASTPQTDASRLDSFLSPEVAFLLAQVLGVTVPSSGRTDLVAMFLKYPGHDPSVCTPQSPCADILHLDLSIPATPPGSQSRLGALGGDPAGFPNGRRVNDDVLDIELRAVTLGLARVGDGVNTNDRLFSETFPYLAAPHQGRDHVHDICPTPGLPGATPSPAPIPTATPTPVATASPTPDATPTPTAAPTATPASSTPSPPPAPTPTATPTPAGGAFVCTGLHAVPDPANPTNGHVFDAGTCNHSMMGLRFRVLGTSYTSFTIPMPAGEFSSTSQPNDTIIGTNPDPAGNPKMEIAGAKFTTAEANPLTIVVTATNAAGQTSQHTVPVPES